MYCFIKYIDYEDFQWNINNQSAGKLVINNKQLIINPDCFIGVILEYVFEKAGVLPEVRDNFDFATEKGKLLRVNTFSPDTNGQQIFTEKLTHYVIYCKDNQFNPMLSPTSVEFGELMVDHQRRSSQLNKKRSIIKSSRESFTSIDSKSKRVNSSSFIMKN